MFTHPTLLSLPLLLVLGCTDDKDEDSALPEEVNEAPVAVDDAASVITGQIVVIDLTDNDSDPNSRDDLQISEIVQPTNGIVEILNNDEVSYTSLNAFVGVDSFSYTAVDEGGLSDDAAVTINVQDMPTLEITFPVEGDNVTSPITVTFEVTGCQVSSPGANPEGCHLHKYLNGEDYIEAGETSVGHYDSTPITIIVEELAIHELQLVLIYNDGNEVSYTPQVDDSVTFTVE